MYKNIKIFFFKGTLSQEPCLSFYFDVFFGTLGRGTTMLDEIPAITHAVAGGHTMEVST